MNKGTIQKRAFILAQGSNRGESIMAGQRNSGKWQGWWRGQGGRATSLKARMEQRDGERYRDETHRERAGSRA